MHGTTRPSRTASPNSREPPPALNGSSYFSATSTRTVCASPNLIGNALKFTKRGSVQVVVRRNPAARTLQLIISDSGPGISPEDVPHIFEMFRQATSTASASSLASVGLGLFIVREFVDQLQGSITVGSSRAGGAEFTVDVPFKLSAPAPSAAATRMVA